MCRTMAMGATLIVCALLLLASVASADVLTLTTKAPLPYVHSAPDAGRVTIDPNQSFVAENAAMSNIPANFDGLVINNFLGADRFYSAGITGQGTKASNIEAGHI